MFSKSNLMFGVPQVQRNGDNLGLFARKLVELGQSHGVGAIVVGLPVQPGGSLTRPASDSAFGRRCRDFAHTLALLCTKTDMQVLLYDESATSSAALLQTENHGVARLESSRKMSRQAKNAQQIDSWSAAMLLHMYYAAPGRAVRINIRHNGPHS